MTILLGLLAAGVAWWGWEKAHRRTRPAPPGLARDFEVPWQQEFELYHNALSLCSMKLRVCLSELAIPYRSHPIDLIETGCYENIRRPLLAVNPGGTVPVLVHRGHPVYESHEQIRYAALHAPEGSPALVPPDPEQRADMERWIDRSSITKNPLEEGALSAGNAVPGLTIPIFATMIEKIPFWKIFEGVLFHFDRRRPFLFIVLKLMGIARLGALKPIVAVLARSRGQMHAHFDALEEQLHKSGGPWILGDFFSLADVSWLVIFERLDQVDALQVFTGGGQRPQCAAYWARLRERPSYREGLLDHSHPMVEYGTRRLKQAKDGDPALRVLLEGAGG